MTEDHFPPTDTSLPGDHTPYPERCDECGWMVQNDHQHARDCSRWRGNQA